MEDIAQIQGYAFTLQGDPARVRATVQQALETRKFRITGQGEWSATAERGNKVANAVVGAVTQYFTCNRRSALG